MWRSRHLAWKRNRWLIIGLAAFTAALLALMGTDKVVPYTITDSLAAQTQANGVAKAKIFAGPGSNVTNKIDVFDIGRVHDFRIKMDPDEYDAMITDYQRDGIKSWHPATVIIDGARLDQVGIRLKGNSTLVGLRYSGPESPPRPASAGIFGTILANQPNRMPFLLRFDQFISGQHYQGVNEIALRAAGTLGDSTQFTDLMANLLSKESGTPYLRAAIGGIRFNDAPMGLSLVIEHPDDYWAQRIMPGLQQPALYKATPGASFHYFGENPASYATVFNQQSGTRRIGPRPMIDFLRFVEKSSDEEFAAQLDKRLDVKEFARYLAFQNLVVDTDSFAGTGNNYYFLYDPTTKLMSISAWDQNIAFGLLGGARYKPYYEDGAALPDFARDLGGVDEFNDGGTGLGQVNILMKRFFETPKYKRLYDETYRDLFEKLFTSGRAAKLMDKIVPPIQAGAAKRHLVAPDAYENAANGKKQFINDRVAFLETQPIITGASGSAG